MGRVLAAILRAILQCKHVPGERDLHQDNEAWPFLMHLADLGTLWNPLKAFKVIGRDSFDPVCLSSFQFRSHFLRQAAHTVKPLGLFQIFSSRQTHHRCPSRVLVMPVKMSIISAGSTLYCAKTSSFSWLFLKLNSQVKPALLFLCLNQSYWLAMAHPAFALLMWATRELRKSTVRCN